MIGDLKGPLAVVDERGRIKTIDQGWSFEWGVGFENRWRSSHSASSTRRHRLNDAPVYETRLRVLGGDIVQRTAVANDGVNRSIVIEFENTCNQAVTVALVGRADAGEVSAASAAVNLDGRVWIQPDRKAGGVVAVAGSQDPWPIIQQGPSATPTSAHGTGVAVGLVMALPHRQSVRFQVSTEGGLLERLVTPAEIASGWRAVTADALSIDVADVDLATAWRRILGDLVVQAGSVDPLEAAEAAPILDIAGLDREADRARTTVVAAAETELLTDGAAVAALRALASRDLRLQKNSGIDQLADVLVAGASDSLDAETANLLARVLETSAPRAAVDARRIAASVSPSVKYQPVTPAVMGAGRVLSPLIDDSSINCIDLLPEMPSEWLGRPVDVRGFGTLWGRASFSVRWHGRRPALLWELTEPYDPAGPRRGRDPVEIRCGSIDPRWSSLEPQGETLLAEPSQISSG